MVLMINTNFNIGDVVKIKNSDITGVIIGILIREKDVIQYDVMHVRNGDINVNTLSEFLIEVVDV